jgi:hypothetical protein
MSSSAAASAASSHSTPSQFLGTGAWPVGGLVFPVLASHALEVSSAGTAVCVTFQWECIYANNRETWAGAQRSRPAGGPSHPGP